MTTYWVYVHENESGDLVEDGGDFEDLGDAVDEACQLLRVQGGDYLMTHTARVVNNDTSTTIWLAGSREHVELGAHLDLLASGPWDNRAWGPDQTRCDLCGLITTDGSLQQNAHDNLCGLDDRIAESFARGLKRIKDMDDALITLLSR